MTAVPSPRTVEHWCKQLEQDLSWLYDGKAGPYRWAHSGLDNLRSPQYQSIGHTGLSDPTGATTMRPPSRELARVREAAKLVHAAQTSLRAARRLLEERDDEGVEAPTTRWDTTNAEHEMLVAKQAERHAAGRGFGAS